MLVGALDARPNSVRHRVQAMDSPSGGCSEEVSGDDEEVTYAYETHTGVSREQPDQPNDERRVRTLLGDVP